ncbi:hypothetical protein J5J86_04265 [Aquabacter sp. L1I39]|nr:hypothetical protein J5J86_04265 [Aquabacter sp. L1I39]
MGKKLKIRVAAVVLSLFVGAPYIDAASAQTGKRGEFTIHNETPGNTVVGFYTNDGTGWSTNWLSEPLEPGDSAELAFTKSSGKCQQTLRVGWRGKSGGEVKDEPIRIDICKASNVYLHDNDVSFD